MPEARCIGRLCLALCLCLGSAAVPAANERNLNLERARAAMERLEDDPIVLELAPREFSAARSALKNAEIAWARNARDYRIDHMAYLAEKRTEIARAVAQRRELEAEVELLQAEQEALLADARKIDAQKARLEAEKARLLSALREEEAERARRDALELAEERRREAEKRAQAEREAAALREEAEQAVRFAEASAAEAQAYRREAEEAVASAAKLRRRLDELQARQTEGGIVLTLADIQFEAGSATLRDSSRSSLDSLADYLHSEHADKRIRVEGHTDSSGAAEFNLRLSQSRAEAVAEYLVSQGIEPGRIQAVGFGEEFPIVANTTEAGRKQNRRVEIIIEGARLADENPGP